jgi:hypothetical protein
MQGFRSPKLFHVIAVSLLVLGAWSCHSRKPTKTNGQSDPQQTNTSVRPLPSATTSAKEAVAKGIDYLRTAPWGMEHVYLYSYLQLQFAWPDIPAQAHTTFVRDSLSRKGDAQALVVLHEMDLFGRLLDPQYRISAAQLASAEELDSVTVPALYCDVFPLDTAVYFPILRGELSASGYRSTHALLCYVWMKANGCLDAATLGKWRAQMVRPNLDMIRQSPGYWSDLNIEAAALIRAAGESYPEDWVAGIVKAQRSDGGWPIFPDGDRSDPHATILALWFLGGL